mgnify:CR=1 FL=1
MCRVGCLDDRSEVRCHPRSNRRRTAFDLGEHDVDDRRRHVAAHHVKSGIAREARCGARERIRVAGQDVEADAGAEPDATLRVGVADFSSLIAGSLRLHDLVRHRLATVTPNGALDRVAALLDAPQRPVCTTRF